MSATCRIVRALAPSHSDRAWSAQLDRHVRTCLGCQAELARYSRLRRHLAALADAVEPAPEPLAALIAAAIANVGAPESAAPSFPHVGRIAAVAAAAAGAVAVAVWRNSRVAVR